MRWRTGALILLAVAALLAMHGLDASTTAAHASTQTAPALDRQMDGDAETTSTMPSSHHRGGLGHLVVSCAAILLAVGSVVAARAASPRLRSASDRIVPSLILLASTIDAIGRPPPPRFATCVIRR